MPEIFGSAPDLLKISPILKESILTDILRDLSGDTDATLKHYVLSPCGTQGDNYLSILTRIRIEGTSHGDTRAHSLAVIVKSLPANISHRKSFRLPEYFSNEVTFYTKVLEKLMSFQKEKNTKKPFTKIPRCFKAYTDGENDFIILEDLSEIGFQTGKRQETYDFEHSAEVIKCLASFHALSFAMKDQNPNEFQEAARLLKETRYSEAQRQWYHGMLKQLLDYSVQAVSIEYPNSVYEQKMKDFSQSDVYGRAIDLAKHDNPHSIITQADSWVPNFLFVYDDSDEHHIKDIRIIDFQISRWANPVYDISLFLYTCTTKEFRDSYCSVLLRIYYNHLSDMIQNLGSNPQEIYPYTVFEAEIKKFSGIGFIISLEAVPVSLLEDYETPKLNFLEGDIFVPQHEIWKFPPLRNKQKIKRLADNVVYAIDNKHI